MMETEVLKQVAELVGIMETYSISVRDKVTWLLDFYSEYYDLTGSVPCARL